MMDIRQLEYVIDKYNNTVSSACKGCLFISILENDYRLYCKYDMPVGTECRFYKNELRVCGKNRCFAWTV